MAARDRRRWHPPKCKECGALAADGHYISARGLCEECGTQRVLIAHAALRAVHTAHQRAQAVKAAREQIADQAEASG